MYTPPRCPKYGRLLQRLASRALAIENPTERRAYYEHIVTMMAGVNRLPPSAPEVREQMWVHLASMMGGELGIDPPCDVSAATYVPPKPQRPAYPGHTLRFRGYGYIVHSAARRMEEQTDPAVRDEMARSLHLRMEMLLRREHVEGTLSERVEADLDSMAHD